MTREEIIREMEKVQAEYPHFSSIEQAVAAELSKCCGGCKFWKRGNVAMMCRHIYGLRKLPQDGSGFCHRWEGKP